MNSFSKERRKAIDLAEDVKRLRAEIKGYREAVKSSGKDLTIIQQLDLLDKYQELTTKLDKLRELHDYM